MRRHLRKRQRLKKKLTMKRTSKMMKKRITIQKMPSLNRLLNKEPTTTLNQPLHPPQASNHKNAQTEQQQSVTLLIPLTPSTPKVPNTCNTKRVRPRPCKTSFRTNTKLCNSNKRSWQVSMLLFKRKRHNTHLKTPKNLCQRATRW